MLAREGLWSRKRFSQQIHQVTERGSAWVLHERDSDLGVTPTPTSDPLSLNSESLEPSDTTKSNH